ncbi:hypothetical protein PYW07_011333 [Mythimna separata]|uniref:LIM zinc-binding domain-containing protein n=1 Tax=Mythimna separata TaxID=271217 RepID=A0AAD8DM22_MYTSE|nr:hypothetical protein PYW07_011333 [Mythimna separata]
MACELCEHCQSPVSREDKVTVREGFSYHKRCHKCYVCSETNLQNAEVFKGVIFCNSCAQRIFQGCSTARRTKTMLTGRGRRNRSKSHRRERDKARYFERMPNRSRDGVIELARLVGSNSESDDPKEQKQKKPNISALSAHVFDVEKNTHVENCFYFQTVDNMKRASPEMGTNTDVTQELLKSIVPEYEKVKRGPPPPLPQRRRQHSYRKRETYESVKTKPTCSDLRIAELGISTEIANMALRKASEVPVAANSNTRVRASPSYTLSVVKMKSAETKSDEDADWVDSAYSTIEESDTSRNVMDRRLGSILTMPLRLFKKHILQRSSLVSVLMSDEQNISLVSRMKQILHEEAVKHQVRGIRRLYSTINRHNPPCKLGWVSLASKVPRDSNVCSCSYGKRCKHFRNSHSYRCMRAQAMKLAGPTHSELAYLRTKIKNIIAPEFIRNMLTRPNIPAIKMSAACQNSCSLK